VNYLKFPNRLWGFRGQGCQHWGLFWNHWRYFTNKKIFILLLFAECFLTFKLIFYHKNCQDFYINNINFDLFHIVLNHSYINYSSHLLFSNYRDGCGQRHWDVQPLWASPCSLHGKGSNKDLQSLIANT